MKSLAVEIRVAAEAKDFAEAVVVNRVAEAEDLLVDEAAVKEASLKKKKAPFVELARFFPKNVKQQSHLAKENTKVVVR